jgi:2-methylcitrate dehydratase PrpD
MDIATIEVASFHEAVRLAARTPATTEEAQYSLPFPVAAAIVRGRLAGEEVSSAAFVDPEIVRLSSTMVLSERAAFNERFPAERYAQVSFVLRDGRRLASPDTTTRGDPATPLSQGELRDKFRSLADPVIGRGRRTAIETAISRLTRPAETTAPLLGLILPAP